MFVSVPMPVATFFIFYAWIVGSNEIVKFKIKLEGENN
jgi:hypothetical protein